MRTNLTADAHPRIFNKSLLHCGKTVFFGLFSGDKGDSIDMWMIKITIKANQTDMDVLFISELMSSMAWIRCYSEKSKNLNKLLVFEALYP